MHLQAVPKSEKKPGGKISIETEKNAYSSDSEVQLREKNNAKRNSQAANDALAKSNMGIVVENPGGLESPEAGSMRGRGD